jgi:hypothetical protein
MEAVLPERLMLAFGAVIPIPSLPVSVMETTSLKPVPSFVNTATLAVLTPPIAPLCIAPIAAPELPVADRTSK